MLHGRSARPIVVSKRRRDIVAGFGRVARWATLGLAIAVTISVPRQTAARQDALGSRNLPVDHWSSDYVKRLRSRGYLTNLNPLVQPYRRRAVALGLAELDPDTLSQPAARWARMLRTEFRRELDRLEGREYRDWGLQATGGGTFSTSQRLDPLRSLGDSDAWPWLRYGGWAEVGPFSAETRLQYDDWLEADPDGVNSGQGRIGRTDNAYVSLSFPFGNLAFGRYKQNWSYMGGLMLSDVATTFPRLTFDFQLGRFTLHSMIGELETLTNPRTQMGEKRYMTAHRLDYVTDNMVLSLGESVVFASNNGPHFRYANPVEVLFATRSDEPRDAGENVALDGQVWFGWRGLQLYGEFFLDDIDVNPGDDAEPFTYAFSVGSRVTSIAPWLELAAEYQQVAAFAYRTPNEVDVWSYLDRGLGDNFSDFDRLTLTADLFVPVPGLRLTPTAQIQRQGEGDLRIPVPPQDIHFASPALFLGVKETTYRLGLRARYQPNRHVWIKWDMGENFIRDADHMAGIDRSDFSMNARAGIVLDFPFDPPR